MVIPIGDENPRSTTPVVTRTFAAVTAGVYLLSAVAGGAPKGLAGFLLSPVTATDPLTLVWALLALFIFADNVEDRLGRLFTSCLLIGTGWFGATARALGDAASVHSPWGRAFIDPPYAGAAAAATAMAIAYAVLFPLHQIKFFNIFSGRRRRGVMSFFDDGRSVFPTTFHVGAAMGILLWGLGMIAGALASPRTPSEFGALMVGVMAGAGAAAFIRAKNPPPALPAELEAALPAAPWNSPAETLPRFSNPKPFREPMPFEAKGWSVLRQTDELYDVGKLGRLVARATGEPVADATRRIRQTRGVLARGLDRARAEELARALTAERIPAFAVDEVATGGLPQAQAARSCSVKPEGLEFEFDGGRKAAVGWGSVAVVAAARIDETDTVMTMPDVGMADVNVAPVSRTRLTQTTLIDVVTSKPAGRFRIARQEEAISSASDSSSAGFRQFAATILQHRGAVPVNKGLSVIAGRGAWGYLAFTGGAAYEEYVWWLLQVIRQRTGPVEPVAAAAGSGSRANYLE